MKPENYTLRWQLKPTGKLKKITEQKKKLKKKTNKIKQTNELQKNKLNQLMKSKCNLSKKMFLINFQKDFCGPNKTLFFPQKYPCKIKECLM